MKQNMNVGFLTDKNIVSEENATSMPVNTSSNSCTSVSLLSASTKKSKKKQAAQLQSHFQKAPLNDVDLSTLCLTVHSSYSIRNYTDLIVHLKCEDKTYIVNSQQIHTNNNNNNNSNTNNSNSNNNSNMSQQQQQQQQQQTSDFEYCKVQPLEILSLFWPKNIKPEIQIALESKYDKNHRIKEFQLNYHRNSGGGGGEQNMMDDTQQQQQQQQQGRQSGIGFATDGSRLRWSKPMLLPVQSIQGSMQLHMVDSENLDICVVTIDRQVI